MAIETVWLDGFASRSVCDGATFVHVPAVPAWVVPPSTTNTDPRISKSAQSPVGADASATRRPSRTVVEVTVTVVDGVVGDAEPEAEVVTKLVAGALLLEMGAPPRSSAPPHDARHNAARTRRGFITTLCVDRGDVTTSAECPLWARYRQRCPVFWMRVLCAGWSTSYRLVASTLLEVRWVMTGGSTRCGPLEATRAN